MSRWARTGESSGAEMAALARLLAAVAIDGVASRTWELGVRWALGATRGEVARRRVPQQGMRSVAGGVALSNPAWARCTTGAHRGVLGIVPARCCLSRAVMGPCRANGVVGLNISEGR